MYAPDIASEENHPGDIEQDGAKEEDSIGATKALTAAFNGYECKQCNGQVDQQHSVVQCS